MGEKRLILPGRLRRQLPNVQTTPQKSAKADSEMGKTGTVGQETAGNKAGRGGFFRGCVAAGEANNNAISTCPHTDLRKRNDKKGKRANRRIRISSLSFYEA